jgi:hypothetical protein
LAICLSKKAIATITGIGGLAGGIGSTMTWFYHYLITVKTNIFCSADLLSSAVVNRWCLLFGTANTT